MRALALAALACACSSHRDAPPPPPPAHLPAALRDIPDPRTLDWRNAVIEVDELGPVQLAGGHAELRLATSETGHVRALPPGLREDGDWPGSLDVDAPLFVDLDGDGHDEAVLRFAVRSEKHDPQFGAFVYALRDGVPTKLATIGVGPEPHDYKARDHAITADGTTWRWDLAQQRIVAE